MGRIFRYEFDRYKCPIESSANSTGLIAAVSPVQPYYFPELFRDFWRLRLTCLRTARHLPTVLLAALCYCGQKAAAVLLLARRIRLLTRASGRDCYPRRMTGMRCAQAFRRAREIGPGADTAHNVI
jgi:hypothetical protein